MKDLRAPLPHSLTAVLLVASVMAAAGATTQKTAGNSASAHKSDKPVAVKAIRHWSSADVTHVAIDLSGPVKYKFAHLANPERLYFDLSEVMVAPAVSGKRFEKQDGFLTNIRVGDVEKGTARVALDLDEPVEYSVNLVPEPYRLEIVFHRTEPAKEQAAAATLPSITIDPPKVVGSEASSGVRLAQVSPEAERQAFSGAHEAWPDGNGERTLVRALGLKIGKIVIDPGHGGDDHGTMSPDGLLEKDVVLDVALRLGRLLQNLGTEVIYTRATDRYLPLEARTAIANREQADLFVSLHANSSPDRDARGVESYYLNFTTSPEALEVAARENTVSRRPMNELRDLVQKIAQQNRIAESHEFAADVQGAMVHDLSGERDRGVREAPFIVLTGANMPAILTEISFMSNAQDESNLKQASYREKIAQALYDGVATYINGLSGVASPAQSAAATDSSLGSVKVLPAAGGEMAPSYVSWNDLMLGFIASNRPFIVIFFLLAAAWSFFLTAPTPAQPAPALANASAVPAVPFPAAEEQYERRPKLQLVKRS